MALSHEVSNFSSPQQAFDESFKIIDYSDYKLDTGQDKKNGVFCKTAGGDSWVLIPPSYDYLLTPQSSPYILNGAGEEFYTRQETVQREKAGKLDPVKMSEVMLNHQMQEKFCGANWDFVANLLSLQSDRKLPKQQVYLEVDVSDFYVRSQPVSQKEYDEPKQSNMRNCGRLDLLGTALEGQLVIVDFTTPKRVKSGQLGRQLAAVAGIVNENNSDPNLPLIHRFKGEYKQVKRNNGRGKITSNFLEFQEPKVNITYELAAKTDIKAMYDKYQETEQKKRK